MVKFIKNRGHNHRPPKLSIPQFLERRHRVLVVRDTGGAGDIFMHRMMFEDFKRVLPGMHLTFATPRDYQTVVEDHPFVDEWANSKTVDPNDYMLYYNTTTACVRYEARISPFSDMHRSDIWASHCGLHLQKHDMHFRIPKENKEFAKYAVNEIRGSHKGPVVGFAPISSRITKDLLPHQMNAVIDELHKNDCLCVGLHNKPIDHFIKLQVPQMIKMKIDHWLAIIDELDYIISVDTGTFHAAGGLGKPLVGIFTYADGKVYGKYYDFVLVQKHRDNGDWPCGPCYNWPDCPLKSSVPKPCLTEITEGMLRKGVTRMLKKWAV